MRVRPRFLIGTALIVAVIAYLIVSAVSSTSEYFLTVSEVNSRQAELAGQPLRIAGRVKSGPIGWDPATLTLSFEIVPIPDPTNAKDGAASADASIAKVSASEPLSYHVICAGQPKPDMFAVGRDVIVEGRLGKDGVITATQVMTSCPSKYRRKQAQ
ncbi:MAG TPA: cytochrome c maturation protein CcmE [Candidatus Binataceae bacterium]|nr:cytochrome c maturation protein CcmE [Candidatus Binataceae bacterium]